MSVMSKLKSVELCLTAHPDYEPDSEFEDRISDLVEAQKSINELLLFFEEKYMFLNLQDQKTAKELILRCK